MEMWFNQEGTSCHTIRDTLTLLRDKFADRILSRKVTKKPPRSCNLTPLHFFLWNHIIPRVYENKPRTMAELKKEIWDKLTELDVATYGRVITNFFERVNVCCRNRSAHMPDAVFNA